MTALFSIVRIALCAAAIFSLSWPLRAGAMDLTSSAGSFSVPVVSLHEARFLTVIRQQYDFSCGSAALATLLTHHYQHPVSEQAVFIAMYENGNKDKIRREGFSLLDIKRYLEAHGYRADGYFAPLDMLTGKGIPAIALINDHGYKHFVVVKGVSDTQVLVGDPTAGMKIIPRKEFEEMWNKLLSVIRNEEKLAVRHFNRAEEWEVREKAPLEQAISRDGLLSSTLFLPNIYDF
ncbi:MAG: C39 family peptidase [Gammaproteobacteria bacterium]|nr:C39 family peptidase [Gammaproteobacteria bacterium]